jgi:hypothetical protein
MKVLIILEDAPSGVYPEIRWQGNGCCDNPSESISMHLATFLAREIERQTKLGVLKVVKEGSLH